MQLPQDPTGLGILIAGIGLGGAAIAFAYKTFKNGKNGNGDTALNAEKRTNSAVKEVLEEIQLTRHDIRNVIGSMIMQIEISAKERHAQIMNLLERKH